MIVFLGIIGFIVIMIWGVRYRPKEFLNMKLVEFENNTYGIRIGWCGLYVYKDFYADFWWTLHSEFIGDCKVSKERAQAKYSQLSTYRAHPKVIN